MTKQLANEVADTFNSLVKAYAAKVSHVGSSYMVTIHCDTFIPTSLLNHVHYIEEVFDVCPYIDCFDNEMVIEIAC